MPRGGKSLPTVLKKLHSRDHHKKRPGKLPQPLPILPRYRVIPASIRHDKIAVENWMYYARCLTQMKVGKMPDRAALSGFCKAYSKAVRADRMVTKHGIIYEKEGMNGSMRLVANPAVMISLAAWREVRMFSQEFGFTPSSRVRIRQEEDETATEPINKQHMTPEDFVFNIPAGKVVGKIA